MEPYGTKALQGEGTVSASAWRQEFFAIELTPGLVLLHHSLPPQALPEVPTGSWAFSVPRVPTYSGRQQHRGEGGGCGSPSQKPCG